jgi:hypothetical protein
VKATYNPQGNKAGILSLQFSWYKENQQKLKKDASNVLKVIEKR